MKFRIWKTLRSCGVIELLECVHESRSQFAPHGTGSSGLGVALEMWSVGLGNRESLEWKPLPTTLGLRIAY